MFNFKKIKIAVRFCFEVKGCSFFMKVENRRYHIKLKDVVNIILILFSIVAIFVIDTQEISFSNNMVIIDDEFGYWGIAAKIAGKDWTPLLSVTAYYSFGYSLLLVPLFLMNLETITMYHAALYLNAVMIIISFLMAIRCIRLLFPQTPLALCIIVSFISNVYVNTIFQNRIAWSETLLWLLFWLTFLTAIRLFQAPTVGKSLILAILCGYSFTVHMRTIGIVFGAAMCMLFAFALHKIKWQHLIAFFSVLLALVTFTVIAQNISAKEVFSSGQFVDMNTIGGQTTKLKWLFSLTGIKLFILSTGGKLYYLATATMMTALVPIPFLLKQLYDALVSIKKKTDYQNLPWLFLALTAGAMFGVNVIAAIYPWERLDPLVYGRYMENVFGPLIMLGLMLLISDKIKSDQITVMIPMLGILAAVTNKVFLRIQSRDPSVVFNVPCIAGWWRLISMDNATANVKNFSYHIFALSITVFLLVWVLCKAINLLLQSSKKNKHAHTLRLSASLLGMPILLFACTWIWECSNKNTSMYGAHLRRDASMNTFYALSQSRDNVEPDDILCVYSDVVELSPYCKFIQTEYPDITVRIESIDEFSENSINHETLVVTSVDCAERSTVEEIAPCIAENDYLVIYALPDSPWTEAAYEMAGS